MKMASRSFFSNTNGATVVIIIILIVGNMSFYYLAVTQTTSIASSAFSIQAVFGGTSSSPILLASLSTIKIDITSQQHIHGVAGQFVKIQAIITNLRHDQAVNGGIAYISIVDIKDKVPIDLEDWSAEKGLYIPPVEPGQSLPLEWTVRLVKAGSYTVDILFNQDKDLSPSVASSKISLQVAPKLNLNPGNVLPIAFGVPAALMGLLAVLNYIRGRKIGIYS